MHAVRHATKHVFRTSEYLTQPCSIVQARFSKTKPILAHYRRTAPRPHNVSTAVCDCLQRTNSAASIWTSLSNHLLEHPGRPYCLSASTRQSRLRTFLEERFRLPCEQPFWLDRSGEILQVQGKPHALTSGAAGVVSNLQVGQLFPNPRWEVG